MAKRYCAMCDKLVTGKECPLCGADTDKWPEKKLITQEQKMTTKQILKQQNTPESRFALAAQRVVEMHGGRPTAAIENGQIVFTYPDGTRTDRGCDTWEEYRGER